MSVETAFTTFPVLHTERFILRQIRPTDAPALLKIFSHPDVVEFGNTPLFTSLDDTDCYIQRGQTGYEARQFLRWGVTPRGDDTVIGTCGLHHFISDFRCVETGYNLHRAYWGRGIIHEAMSAVLNYGFMDLGCHRIEAVIDSANTRSRSLALKLGFTYEGTLRQRYLGKHGLEDECYYAILKPEWLAKQTDPA